MSLYGWIAPRGPNGFGYASTAEEVSRGIDLSGKTMLVTGMTSGIGWETARVLRLRGAHVLGTGRTREKAEEAARAMGALPGPFTAIPCELSDARSIRDAIGRIRDLGLRLDALVANAGIMALPRLEQAYGIELQFFTNHIGHFMLITGLLDQLTERGRVVVVSSEAHRHAPRAGIEFDNLSGERGYSPWRAYGQSKMANILFARALARRFEGTGRTANALHPGVIRTNLGRHMPKVMDWLMALATPIALKSIEEGAATQTYLAVHPEVEGRNGEYYSHCQPIRPRADALDPALAERLWEESERIVERLPK
ncbi:MAG: SDR family oxidoreductase [Deltaproteobacteria bacterium]|nr:SDR family oxidoreductase [Deltaproteobacteria bacterium]